jgi:hypothetical protein
MTRRRDGRARAVATVLLLSLPIGLGVAAPSQAADPGRWVETGFSAIPLWYYQGVTSDPAGDLYFDGFTVGLYRTGPALDEGAAVSDVIPFDVQQREGYNHVGDITWDGAERGRVLLPLECYVFGLGNFCGTGSIGVADPRTLAWRYYVKLDQTEIKKAMWAEVSPDGQLIWTSAGNDLLAYRSSDITPGNAAPEGPPVHPARRLVGAVPPSGVTGATFYGDRLFVAGQDAGPFQVWSIDVNTGERRLEIEREIAGESEGLDVFDGLGGVLHWQIGWITFRGPPTYGQGHTALVHFVPANRPPDCSNAIAEPGRLWPPNHRLRLVTAGGVGDPDGDAVTVQVTDLTQDEPIDGLADGSTSPDWNPGPSSDQVWLRAERSGAGDGRVYTLALRATDVHGATCTGTAVVTVPHQSGS